MTQDDLKKEIAAALARSLDDTERVEADKFGATYSDVSNGADNVCLDGWFNLETVAADLLEKFDIRHKHNPGADDPAGVR